MRKVAVCPSDILYHQGYAPHRAQAIGDESTDNIAAAARQIADDNLDRAAGGIALIAPRQRRHEGPAAKPARQVRRVKPHAAALACLLSWPCAVIAACPRD